MTFLSQGYRVMMRQTLKLSESLHSYTHTRLLVLKSSRGSPFLQATNKPLARQIDAKADTVCVNA